MTPECTETFSAVDDVLHQAVENDDADERLTEETMMTTTVSTTTETSHNMNGSSSSNSILDDDNDDAKAAAFFFLSPRAAHEISRFEYKGQDLSLLYHYILSPLATFCVNRLTPRTMAPNTITLTGLVFMIFSYSCMWYYVPTMEQQPLQQEPPRWIFLCNAICILLYQTLDNMDGKQARRTQSSSPLGLLFDHGCDAVNSVFGSANWMIAMALHPRLDATLCWIVLFGPYALFYIGTWEEYHTGALIMPIINGPNEGLMGAAMMSLTSWFYGCGFWQQDSWWRYYIQPNLATILPATLLPEHVRNADLLLLASTIGFVQEVSSKIISVVHQYGAKALWNLVPFTTLAVCSFVIAWADLDLWLKMPRTCLHLCAILFVEMTAALMLAHMSKQAYQPFRWVLLPIVLLTLVVVSGYKYNSKHVQDFLLMYTSGAAVFLLMKTAIIIHEICTILDIWCFDIVSPRQSRLTGLSCNGSDPKHVKVE